MDELDQPIITVRLRDLALLTDADFDVLWWAIARVILARYGKHWKETEIQAVSG